MSKSLTRTTPSTNAERTANAPRACKREIDYMSSRIHEIVLFIEKNGLHPDSELQVDMQEIRLLKEKMPLLLKKMPSRVVAESPAGGVDEAVNGGENLALDYRSEQGDAVTPLDAEEQPPRWTGTSFGLLCCRENAAMDQWDEDTLPMLHAVQGDHVVQANKDMQQSGDTALEDGLEKKKTVSLRVVRVFSPLCVSLVLRCVMRLFL